MIQPDRNYSSLNYRFGFNGKENDNEVKGTGNQQDYGMRIYDPRVGRFLSVDPIAKEYPALSSYQFASNSPVAGRDRDGLEFEPYWSTTAPASNRKYENDLHKKDPKNANAIIRQHNIDAFMLVGGALSGGSGKLFTAFIDGVMAWGGYKTTKGIINHDAAETTEGVRLMGNAAMGEVGGMLIGKTFEVVSPLIRSVGKSLTGTWVKESTAGWSKNAIEYQEFVTGFKAGEAFEVNGVRFDNYKNNTLIEAKSSYDNFVNSKGEYYSWFMNSKTGANSLLDQARRQLVASEGTAIEWNFSSQKTLDATKKLFKDNNIEGINLKLNPKK